MVRDPTISLCTIVSWFHWAAVEQESMMRPGTFWWTRGAVAWMYIVVAKQHRCSFSVLVLPAREKRTVKSFIQTFTFLQGNVSLSRISRCDSHTCTCILWQRLLSTLSSLLEGVVLLARLLEVATRITEKVILLSCSQNLESEQQQCAATLAPGEEIDPLPATSSLYKLTVRRDAPSAVSHCHSR